MVFSGTDVFDDWDQGVALPRRAFVNQDQGLDQKASIANAYTSFTHWRN